MSVLDLPPPTATLPVGHESVAGSSSFFISGTIHRPYRLGQKITADDLAEEMEETPTTIGRKFGGGGGIRKSTGGSGSGPGSGFRGSVSLVDLVESGVLVAGRGKITCSYKGQTVAATLTEDGSIEYQGRKYQSATAFSIFFKRTITPSKQGDDGWKSVFYDGRPLEHYRKILQEQKKARGELTKATPGGNGGDGGTPTPGGSVAAAAAAGRGDIGAEATLMNGVENLNSLGVDYAPALTGFDIRGGRSVPSIESIVVCTEHEDAVRAAFEGETARRAQQAKDKRMVEAEKSWRELLRALLTRVRLANAYSGNKNGENGSGSKQPETAEGEAAAMLAHGAGQAKLKKGSGKAGARPRARGEATAIPVAADNAGVQQGSAASNPEWNLVADVLTRQIQEAVEPNGGIQLYSKATSRSLTLGSAPLPDSIIIKVLMLLLADDIASFSKNEAELDFLLQRINEVYTRWGLKVSIAKTNILVIASGERPPDPRVSLNGEEIKVVEHAKYLGSWYSNNGSIEKEINVRVGAAWGAGRKLGPILRAKKVSIKSKVHMYQSLVLPILTYGAESWPLTTALTAKLEPYHQCQLRAILGLSWRDMVSNKEVHERLKTVSMEECCRRQRMLWMGHVVRMPDNRLPKILLFGQMEGHRIRGRKLSLRRLYEKDIMELKGGFPDGLDWYELASDRKIWPKFVMREPLAQQPATESNGLQTTNGLQTASAAAVDANTHADGGVIRPRHTLGDLGGVPVGPEEELEPTCLLGIVEDVFWVNELL
ncbi:hypothetical protein KSW81_005993 [Nannochloris sp. 'desiccata']|nr:hypothetical protein KSW81_005993 [Chlorella desiccata (nom. nud.)]